jgi:hypothetical protein
MFATLLGALPRPPLDEGADLAALVEAAVRAQEAAGLEPITDGGVGGWSRPVEGWRSTAALTDRAVKQAIVGPYTLGWSDDAVSSVRAAATLDRAEALNAELLALAEAGCGFIEVHEPAATTIGANDAERALFRDAHRRLLDGLDGTHCSLALTGGNADAAGIDTFLAAPYASLAVDLIDGPDNWRLVVATPGDRGVVCGVVSAAAGSDDGPEILLWAADYAASTGGRGRDRVGLATASSLADLTWADATLKMTRIGAAARLVDLPGEERLSQFDPRAIDIRSAAFGRWAPGSPRRRR